jgi:pimeloyl-ACP methyl ester carboxylesterase
MNGEYDFATDPDDAREVADGIDQAQAIEMTHIGHFPMSENPDLFNEYIKIVLDDIRGEDVTVPDKLTPEDVGIDIPEVAGE